MHVTTSAPSNVAGSLIAALEQGGELVDAGEFSIDAGQALVKLRDYQLVDPHGWVLLLIEAAVLAGQEPVTIPSNDEFDEFVLELGPLELHADELEQLFAWVFIELDDVTGDEWRRRRALQQLALASNAVLGLRPDALVIESIDHEGKGTRLRLTPERPLGVLEPIPSSPEARPGTRVRVEGLGRGRELALVRERCRYTTHDIRIGDERISRGPAGAIVDAEFEAQHEQGGWAPSARTKPLIDEQGRTIGRHGKAYRVAARPTLLIVSNGVLIERLEFDASVESAFVAVVEVDLPRDLSQAKVRRGPEFDAIVRVAHAAAESSPGLQPTPAPTLELASGPSIAPFLLYSFMASIGLMGSFFALVVMFAGARGVGPWLAGLLAIGLLGVLMLKRTKV